MQTTQMFNSEKARVEGLVYEKNGRKFIALGNYALDFKKEYLYLGMSKSGQVILGEERNGQMKRRYGKVENGKIYAESCRFIERLPQWGGISI